MHGLMLIQTHENTVKIVTIYFSHKATAQLGTYVRARVFIVGLLARSQFASGRSCVVFLGPRANAELVPKFRVALLCMLHIQPSQWQLNFAVMQPFEL
jgi:hypothetical protein